MPVFDDKNINFNYLPPDVPILSLFAKKDMVYKEIMPWMDMDMITKIVVNQMMEVVKKQLETPIETVKPPLVAPPPVITTPATTM